MEHSKSRDKNTATKNRRILSKSRNKSRRSESISKKRQKKTKHILLCGHGSLPPDKKGGFPFLPNTFIVLLVKS